MKLSEFKRYLSTSDTIVFELWNGEQVPSHYHITEIGAVSKKFIDCGGEIRHEESISFQLRTADDTDHRLEADTMIAIIQLFENNISSHDAQIQIEYQWKTIGKYGLERIDEKFILMPTMTDCLAKDTCWVSEKSCFGGGCC